MKFKLPALLLMLFAALGFAFSAGFLTHEWISLSDSGYPVLDEALELLMSRALNSPENESALEYGMIRGLAEAYDDPFTMFVEPAQHELNSDNLAGKFGGIGVEMDRDASGAVFLYPFSSGPAAQAGIQSGDQLLAIDGLPISAETDFDVIRAQLRGPVESQAMLLISRPGLEPLTFEIERAEVTLPSVTWRLLIEDPTVGYIALHLLAESSPAEIEAAASELKAAGAEHLILDLRNSGGGLLDAGINTARLFLETGPVLEHQYRHQALCGRFSGCPL